ncbi:MAG: hypothetical protein KJ630_16455 [Proteobacteria bacterium]|nr:hypothetical protein [Pseudomonadota bacterium]
MVIIIAAAILGVIRYKIYFFPGLQGIIVGMLLGAIIGKLGSNSEEMYSFHCRIHTSLAFSVLFVIAQTIMVSILNTGHGDHIFTWIWNILNGNAKEYFASAGKTGPILKTASGGIDGFWWIFMSIMETVLFAFSFLMGLILGLPSGKNARIKYRD